MSTTEHTAGARVSDAGGRPRRNASRLAEDNRRLKHSEQRLLSVLAGGRICWFTLYADGDRLELSTECKALFGFDAAHEPTFAELMSRIVFEDRAERDSSIRHTLRTGEDYDAEYRVRHPDGRELVVHARGQPLRDASGEIVGLTGVVLDVTDRRQALVRERMMREEAQHRLKNTLATVQALASQTLRTSDDLDQFRANFGARLEALGRSMTVGVDGRADTLLGALERALEPYLEAGAERFRFEGPEVRLGDKAATALSLVAHELATNAMKYGALSGEAGRVDVAWRVRDGEVELCWRESGGPPVTPPARRGFGTRLVERAAPMELRGHGRIDYAPEGLSYRLEFPLPV